MTTTSTERSATRTEIAVCESHRRRGLYLREWSTPAVNREFPEYRVTVAFLHPGWVVADWYGDELNDCLIYDTQAEADAEADRRQAVECEARDGAVPVGECSICELERPLPYETPADPPFFPVNGGRHCEDCERWLAGDI